MYASRPPPHPVSPRSVNRRPDDAPPRRPAILARTSMEESKRTNKKAKKVSPGRDPPPPGSFHDHLGPRLKMVPPTSSDQGLELGRPPELCGAHRPSRRAGPCHANSTPQAALSKVELTGGPSRRPIGGIRNPTTQPPAHSPPPTPTSHPYPFFSYRQILFYLAARPAPFFPFFCTPYAPELETNNARQPQNCFAFVDSRSCGRSNEPPA